MKEKAEQLQANNKQVQTQKNVIDMLAVRATALGPCALFAKVAAVSLCWLRANALGMCNG